MAKAVMIQGTGSGAGKSLIAVALCRIFKGKGIDVAPFKAQNMALNSFITKEGGEIGRAQALQARAARLDPSNDMNPVLLKVSGESGSQVIIHGRVYATMTARNYYAFRDEAWKAVVESYARLSKGHDLIVIEGAGSPAEINLMDVDIVNMAMARHARAPVILLGDIDKGGVFASLYGTVRLLGRDGRRIKGFVINKFRGDMAILEPGLEMIRKMTKRPVLGVIPYIHDIGLPEEDGLALEIRPKPVGREAGAVKIVVVRLKYISNFTDFDPFMIEHGVELFYSDNPVEIEDADIVILPGSKNTVSDLMLLKQGGIDESIKRAYESGAMVIGICGGYQMLGKVIRDPYRIESHFREVEGIGLLNIETVFNQQKTTCRVEAEVMDPGLWACFEPCILMGYEIHMGESSGDIGLFRIKRVSPSLLLGKDKPDAGPLHIEGMTQHPEIILDGSANGNCWGTYLHGIFENDSFRAAILNHARARNGLSPINSCESYADHQEAAIDRLAGLVEGCIDMDAVWRMIT